MATSTVAPPADEARSSSRWARPPWGSAPQWSARAAAVTFAAYLAVALVWLIVVAGDKHWFIGDDWGMLVERSLGDPVGWFAAQNTHWSTVPTVTYLGLFKIFGLHGYVPYMAAVVVAHLVLAVLLRTVMRRVGVGPWVATIVAGSFVLYGTGQQNVVFAIQISMVTSMVFGVGHLLLADHDGGFDRRDAVGLGLGLLAIMASGVGPPMVMMVGVFVLLRRGWRLALIHTVPVERPDPARLLTRSFDAGAAHPPAAPDPVPPGHGHRPGVDLEVIEAKAPAARTAPALTAGRTR